MKLIKTLVVASAFCAVSAYAVEPVRSEITCAELGDKYEATAEAKVRFADLAGSCDGVYEINGKTYVRSAAVVRQIRGSKVRLYLPATDHTFEVSAQSDGRVLVGNRKMRVRDLNRGDEIGIYLSVDKFAEEKVDEIAFATEEEHVEEIMIAPVEEIEALPTTG
ncbi:hypothetical protein ACFL3I_07310 [Pseudomonadota bacterium]